MVVAAAVPLTFVDTGHTSRSKRSLMGWYFATRWAATRGCSAHDAMRSMMAMRPGDDGRVDRGGGLIGWVC